MGKSYFLIKMVVGCRMFFFFKGLIGDARGSFLVGFKQNKAVQKQIGRFEGAPRKLF